jgi:hypothetical protein
VIRIYKYDLTVGKNTIDMPWDAEIIHVAARSPNDRIQMWANLPNGICVPRPRDFYVFPTGEFEGSTSLLRHVGTAITTNGWFVWHVFATPYEHRDQAP